MTRRLVFLPVLLLATSAALPCAAAQPSESATAALVKELTGLLEKQKLDAVAARLDGDVFAAAIYLPGSELLVVSARYSAPALLNEKLLSRQYKDVYADLSTTSLPDSKMLIEDTKADGLRAQPGKDPFDVVTHAAEAPLNLDGKWKDRKMSEETYSKVFHDAESVYRKSLEAMIAELKKPR
jgi:hypothetical protein